MPILNPSHREGLKSDLYFIFVPQFFKMEFLYLTIGCLLGFAIGWFFSKSKNTSTGIPEKEFQNLRSELSAEREKLLALTREKTTVETQFNTQKQEIENVQARFKIEFENLANSILKEKTKEFTEQNKTNLETILNPLKENLTKFEKKVDDTYKAEASERNSLKGVVMNLAELNKRISEEASNLTKALKGDTKKQGDWGELRLELILEKAGLQKDIHYGVQKVFSDSENTRKPDFIIYLPENKHLIIDSKVSLTAFVNFIGCEDESQKAAFLKGHLDSIRKHIKELSEKKYHQIYQINPPDFVLMYVPTEPAFALATQTDPELFLSAVDKKIVLVTSSTLLATLSTVSFMWKQENQKRNVYEIARQGGELYDKFVGFIEDLVSAGKALDGAKEKYSSAMNKLVESPKKGDTIIGRIETLKKLGANADKQIPQSLLDRANEK